MTIGFAATAYDTHFQYLQSQTISFDEFDAVIDEPCAGARARPSRTRWPRSRTYYGLTTDADQPLTLTGDELSQASRPPTTLSMLPAEEQRATGRQRSSLLYGGYEPLSMAVSHILNNKAGIAYTSYAHTGLQLPVYAQGVGAELFAGSYDNTDIFTKTMKAMGLSA